MASNAINDNGSGLFQSMKQIIPMFWCLIIAFGSTGIDHKQKEKLIDRWSKRKKYHRLVWGSSRKEKKLNSTKTKNNTIKRFDGADGAQCKTIKQFNCLFLMVLLRKWFFALANTQSLYLHIRFYEKNEKNHLDRSIKAHWLLHHQTQDDANKKLVWVLMR